MMQCKITCCGHNYYLPNGFGMQCHYCKRPLACDESSVIVRHQPRSTGPELWAKLHNYRWTKFTDFREWLDGWLKEVDRLPYCSCGAKFRSKILPSFEEWAMLVESDREWFVLTVRVHNAVNATLGKEAMSLEDAKKIWRNENQYEPNFSAAYSKTGPGWSDE